jgi:hypothetical protein
MEFSLPDILQALVNGKVEFILVGGMAAVAQGAPLNTFDVDIVFAQDPENISRILTVLESLDAIFRIQPSRRLRPNISHLAGNGHINLQTRYGPLDLLTNIGENLHYPDLTQHSRPMRITEGITIQVLNLKTLIELKEQLNGEKDRAMLPILRRTLRESEK